MIPFSSYNDVVANIGTPCYFEFAEDPSDISFQVNTGGVTTLAGLTISVLSVEDGSIVEANISSLFSIVKVGNNHVFTLNKFSSYMCLCRRFIVLIRSEFPAFSFYYGVYEIEDCCSSNFVIDVDGDIVVSDTEDDSLASKYITSCKADVLRIESWNKCLDNVNGDNFSGGWKKKSLMEGRVILEPSEVQKTFSRNCKLLYVEVADLYTVELFQQIPSWKFKDLEAHIRHENFTINGEQYHFIDGSIGKRFEDDACSVAYAVKFKVQKCAKRQYFGCGDSCSSDETERLFYYAIPNGDDTYYTEDKSIIGDLDGLIAWLNGQGGYVQSTYSPSQPFLVYQTSFSAPSFYVNGVYVGDRVFPSNNPIIPVANRCGSYAVQYVVISDEICPGSYTVDTVVIEATGDAPPIEVVEDTFILLTGVTAYVRPTLAGGEIITVLKDSMEVDATDYTFDSTSATLTITVGAAGEIIKVFAKI